MLERSALTISLYAPDTRATVGFYCDVLGFTHTAEWTEDGEMMWAEVCRDGPKGTARLWFFSRAFEGQPVPDVTGSIYLFVGPVDDEAARIGANAEVRWGPEDQVYGLREFAMFDCNGYTVCFAEDR